MCANTIDGPLIDLENLTRNPMNEVNQVSISTCHSATKASSRIAQQPASAQELAHGSGLV